MRIAYCLLMMLVMLLFPGSTGEAARSALQTWVLSVVPSLFPYMVLCRMLASQLAGSRLPPALLVAALGLAGGSPSGAATLSGYARSGRLRRDALLPLFSACGSYEEARAYVLAHGQEVQQTCEAVLVRRGETYGASLLLGKQTFPDRVYADTLYPAGTYDALEVVLGEGGGHNWWCVLFPPLCLVTEEGEPVDLDALSFESDVLALLKAAFPGWFK